MISLKGNKTCKDCGKISMCKFSHKYKGKNVYVNSYGKMWYGQSCPTCFYKGPIMKKVYKDDKEMSKINNLCSQCDELVDRKFHSFTKTNKKKYVDGTGRFWKGNACPDCSCPVKKVDKEFSHRKCSECYKKLPKSRYFKCEVCQPVLSSDDGDLTYFASDEEMEF